MYDVNSNNNRSLVWIGCSEFTCIISFNFHTNIRDRHFFNFHFMTKEVGIERELVQVHLASKC